MATAYQGRLARLRAKQESSMGADMTSTIGSNWDDIPARIDTIKYKRNAEIVQPGHVIQRLDQSDPGVEMPRDAELEFETNLEVPTSRAGSTVASAPHWLGRLFESGWGGVQSSTGTTVASTSTSTVLNVTSASTYRAGGGIAVPTAGGVLEIRVIKSITSNAITLKMALSAAPANGTICYGVTTYYLRNNPAGADPVYQQFGCEGYNPKDRWIFPGAALKSFKFLGLEPKGLPGIAWGWQVPMWGPADGSFCSANLQSAALGLVAYADVSLNSVRASDLRLRDLSSSALPTFLNAPKVDIATGIEYEPLMTPGGGTGLCANSSTFAYRRIEQSPKPTIQVNLDAHWGNDTVLDGYHAAGTELGFTQQVGNSITKGGFCIEVPRLQMMGPPNEMGIGGMKGKHVELRSMHDLATYTVSAGATTADDELAQAAIRLLIA